jgi:hypothetical protein
MSGTDGACFPAFATTTELDAELRRRIDDLARALPPFPAAVASSLLDAWREPGDQRHRHVLDHLLALWERSPWSCWA